MWGMKKDFRELESEIKELREQKRKLEEEVENLKLKKKIEEEDIRHMVRLKEEKLEIDHQKKAMELERKHQDNLHGVQNAYRDKMERHLERQVADIKEMYAQILERLPNVNLRLKGDA